MTTIPPYVKTPKTAVVIRNLRFTTYDEYCKHMEFQRILKRHKLIERKKYRKALRRKRQR